MIDFSVPLNGFRQAEDNLDRTASRIAKGTVPDPAPGDTIDLSQEAVALLTERTSAEANLKVIHTEDEVARDTLNLLG